MEVDPTSIQPHATEMHERMNGVIERDEGV